MKIENFFIKIRNFQIRIPNPEVRIRTAVSILKARIPRSVKRIQMFLLLLGQANPARRNPNQRAVNTSILLCTDSTHEYTTVHQEPAAADFRCHYSHVVD